MSGMGATLLGKEPCLQIAPPSDSSLLSLQAAHLAVAQQQHSTPILHKQRTAEAVAPLVRPAQTRSQQQRLQRRDERL